jgi:hypothetical protein
MDNMNFEQIFKDEESLQEALKTGFHIKDYMFISNEGLEELKVGEHFRVGPFVGTCVFKGDWVVTMKMDGRYKSWEQYHMETGRKMQGRF